MHSSSPKAPYRAAGLLPVRTGGDILAALGAATASPSAQTLVEICAERWSGKSTVLQDLAATLRGRGWTTASNSASPSPSGRPFGIFVDALADHVEHFDTDRLSSAGHDHVAPLAALFPSVRAATGMPAGTPTGVAPGTPTGVAARAGVSAPPEPDPDDTYGVCRAVRALLRELAVERPLLLALDDVHWADESSLRLLAHLLEHPVEAPVLLVVSHRGRPADRTLNALLSQPCSRTVQLRVAPAPLSDEEALALLPEDLSRVHCEALVREGGGRPGLLRTYALLRHVPGPDHASPGLLPADVLAQVLRDFRALSPGSSTVVRAAAVLEGPFTLEELRVVSQVDEAGLSDAVDQLIDEELLRPGELPSQLRFHNPLLRAAAYQWAGSGWLLGVHAQAARALDWRGRPAGLARHLERSAAICDRSSARVLLDAAARWLWQDPAQAVSWIRTALMLRTDLEVGARDRLPLGQALALSGRLCESLAVLGPLADAPDAESQVAAEALRWRARVDRLLRGTGGTGSRPDAATPVPAYAEGTAPEELLLGAGPEEEPVQACAPGAADPAPGPEHGRLLARRAVRAALTGDTEQAMRCAAEAGPLLRSAVGAGVDDQLDGLYWLGTAMAELGRPEAAAAGFEEGLRIAQTCRLTMWVPVFATALGTSQLHSGDVSGALRHAACAELAAAATDSPYLRERAAGLRREVADCADCGDRAPALASQGPGDNAEARSLAELSRREREVARLVSTGRTNQQIARALELSHKTVETYLGRIFQKLQVQSRAEVATLVGRSEQPALASTGAAAP